MMSTKAIPNAFPIFLKLSYFFLICPFYLSKSSSKFEIKTWIPQTFLCGLNNILCILWIIGNARQSFTNLSYSTPSYFTCALSILNIIRRTATLKTFWLKRTQFLNLVNFLANLDHEQEINSDNHHFLPKLLIFWLISVIFTVGPLVSFITGTKIQMCTNNPISMEIGNKSQLIVPTLSGAHWWLQNVLQSSNYIFFRQKDCNKMESIESLSFLDVIQVIFGGIAFLQRHLLSFYCDMFLIFATLSFWIAGNSFFSCLQSCMTKRNESIVSMTCSSLAEDEICDLKANSFNNKWENIFQKYEALVSLVNYLNNLLSCTVTWFLIESILYYSTSYGEIIIWNGSREHVKYWWWKLARLLIFSVGSFSVLLLAADGNRKVTGYEVK